MGSTKRGADYRRGGFVPWAPLRAGFRDRVLCELLRHRGYLSFSTEAEGKQVGSKTRNSIEVLKGGKSTAGTPRMTVTYSLSEEPK